SHRPSGDHDDVWTCRGQVLTSFGLLPPRASCMKMRREVPVSADVYAIQLPSGLQIGDSSSAVSSVSRWGSPPPVGAIQMSPEPGRRTLRAICVPFGDRLPRVDPGPMRPITSLAMAGEVGFPWRSAN